MLSIKYRPEIDGLRAIAVMAVILYHAKFMLHGKYFLKGGYIGVDIFFVISGYLITSIILNEIKSGTFSYLKFYERRARRILPPLFTVMLASIPLAYVFMMPKSMKEYSASVLSSLFFDSNIWFWREDSYWAEPSALKPFLHTWSLSIEEQFYFLFPAILILLWKYGRKYATHSITALFLLSLLAAQIYCRKYASAAFYLLPMRGWELLAGALLANLEMNGFKTQSKLLHAIMPAIGLILVIGSIIYFTAKTRHPSFITLLPVIGTMLLIWFGKQKGWVSSILASRLFVCVGLISYELYLWHFPIFAFSKIHQPDSAEYEKIIWIILTFALAIATYYLIGKPARKTSISPARKFFPILTSVFLCLLMTEVYFYQTNGAEFRFARFSKIVEMNYWDEKKPYYNEFSTHPGCWLSERNITPGHPFQLCQSREALNPTKRIMVIGDSNAASLIPGLVKHFGKNNIVQRVVDGCLPARKFATNFCKKGITAAFNDINKIHPDVIIIGGFYLLDEHLQQMQFLFDHELKDYRNKTIILGPLPRWGIEGLPAKLMKAYNLYPYKIPEMLAPSPETFTLDKHLAELAKTWGVAYLSPVKTFCSETKCLVRVGTKRDEIVTWDFAHLTHHASYVLVEKNADLIRKFVG